MQGLRGPADPSTATRQTPPPDARCALRCATQAHKTRRGAAQSSVLAERLLCSAALLCGKAPLDSPEPHPTRVLLPGPPNEQRNHAGAVRAAAASADTGTDTLELTEANVEAVLDEVRPYLMADGGNVEFVEIDGLVVRLRLKGACGSCPSSLTTMTMGIKRRLMERIPVRFVLLRVRVVVWVGRLFCSFGLAEVARR